MLSYVLFSILVGITGATIGIWKTLKNATCYDEARILAGECMMIVCCGFGAATIWPVILPPALAYAVFWMISDYIIKNKKKKRAEEYKPAPRSESPIRTVSRCE